MCYQPGVHHRRRRRQHSSFSSPTCRALAELWGLDTSPSHSCWASTVPAHSSPMGSSSGGSPLPWLSGRFTQALCLTSASCWELSGHLRSFIAWPPHFHLLFPRPHGHHFGLWAILHTPLPLGLLSLGFFLFEVSHTVLTLWPLPPSHHHPTRSFKSGIFKAALVSSVPQLAPFFLGLQPCCLVLGVGGGSGWGGISTESSSVCRDRS